MSTTETYEKEILGYVYGNTILLIHPVFKLKWKARVVADVYDAELANLFSSH